MKNSRDRRHHPFARIAAAKEASRRRRARMPFAHKVETVVRLQEISAAAKRAMGKAPRRTPWRLSGKGRLR